MSSIPIWRFGSRSRKLAVVLCVCASLGQAQERSARIDWLSKHAIPIGSIDPTIPDDDFADLKPLIAAIGNSRVVVLGEQSHGDGATFLAKGRLIKFLHQKMGFDVLAWEAGLFNCQEMGAAVRNPSVPIEDAIRLGMYPIWGSSAQVRPVFEYARSVAATKRPLEMIGFDHQFSGMGGSGFRWRDAMIAFIDKADAAILPETLRSSLMNDAALVFKGDSKPADLRSVAEKWKTLPRLLDGARSRLKSVHGARHATLMRRTADDAVISLEGLARFREAAGQFKTADNNFRDKRMAEHLIWLVNDRYKGRRLIVWAATFHAMHEPSAIQLAPGSPFSYQGVVTMGELARKSLGRQMYTVGFTAADGRSGNVMGGQTVELKTSEDGSFEDVCMRGGHRFSFVDFRPLAANHWLRQPVTARLLAHSPIETDWTRQVDALVFTQTMFPSTKGPMAPDGIVLTEDPAVRRVR